MKNRGIIIVCLLLVISLFTTQNVVLESQLRKVEYVSILATGMLLGILLSMVIKAIKDKKANSTK